ncbi:MAG: LON peptidase substrate-binding domain-containing protein [Calditrichaeota bacterium]|nr:LON peptidase substrate-binding domain-containing protein [Calditrichota bacterium]
MNPTIIPIFPLNVVLFPGIPLPLHIFEERYKEMIHHCIETNAEFGVVLYEKSRVSQVGCSAIVQELLEEYEDGQMDILTEGIRRFHIERIIDEKSYLQAEVKFLPAAKSMPENKLLQKNAYLFLRKIMRFTDPQLNSELFRDADTLQLSHLGAASGGFSLDEKQRFLEMDDVPERLELMMADKKSVMERVRLHQLIKNAEFMEGNFSRN